MKNWKIIGLILIILLAVVAVSGCIGDDSSSDSTTLSADTLNITEDGTYDSKEEVAAYMDGMVEVWKNMLLENALEGIPSQTDNLFYL